MLLGSCYEDGVGVERDDALALDCHRRAAEQDYAYGLFAYGWMFANGRGTAKDLGAAAHWYRRAADRGQASALTCLGTMHLDRWPAGG